jgi:co-chaperonin GroES (HSP10)
MKAIKPIGDYILIRSDQTAGTVGAISLPDQSKQSSLSGIVVSVGDGHVTKGGFILRPSVQIGDRVHYETTTASEVSLDNERYTIIRAGDVLGIES